MASVTPFKNPSGEMRWRVQFRIAGKGRQETFIDKRDAERFAKSVDRVGGEHARELLRGRENKPSRALNLTEWFEKYVDPDSGILTGIQPGTRHGYRRIAVNSFLIRLGELPIDEITPDDVGSWIGWQEAQPSRRQKGRPIAAKTVHNYHALLSNVLEAAHKRKLIDDNPAKGARITRGQSREGVFLTPHEFDQILDHVLPHYKPLVVFLVVTGARWGEATALTWGDINQSVYPPTARINKAWKKGVDGTPVLGPPKSKKSRRTIPIGDLALDYLPALPAHGKPDDLVFPGVGGGRIWYGMFNTRIWKRAIERADIGKTPNIHDLRHTAASWLIVGGTPLTEVQAQLGHEKIDTTAGVYSHMSPDTNVNRARVMNAATQGIKRPVLELEA